MKTCSMKLVKFGRLHARLYNMPHIYMAANTSCILLGAKGGSGKSCDHTAPHGMLRWRVVDMVQPLLVTASDGTGTAPHDWDNTV
jgi:hypothetical protein